MILIFAIVVIAAFVFLSFFRITTSQESGLPSFMPAIPFVTPPSMAPPTATMPTTGPIIPGFCTADSDCISTSPFCVNNVCVRCRLDNDCPNKAVCVGSTCSPVECTADTDCPPTTRFPDIDVSNRLICADVHVCVECLSDSDCTFDPAKPFCDYTDRYKCKVGYQLP